MAWEKNGNQVSIAQKNKDHYNTTTSTSNTHGKNRKMSKTRVPELDRTLHRRIRQVGEVHSDGNGI